MGFGEARGEGRQKPTLPRWSGGGPSRLDARAEDSKEAAHVDFDWSNEADVLAKVDEELAETKEALASENEEAVAEEIGDLLFAVVNLARKRHLDAETLLQAATDKFVRRFNAMEDELRAQGKSLGEVGLVELDAIWNAQKAALHPPRSGLSS